MASSPFSTVHELDADLSRPRARPWFGIKASTAHSRACWRLHHRRSSRQRHIDMAPATKLQKTAPPAVRVLVRTRSPATLMLPFTAWSCVSWSWYQYTRWRPSFRSSPWRQPSSSTLYATFTRCVYRSTHGVDFSPHLTQAFVIYCFFVLLLDYLGGERSLLILLHGRPPIPAVFPVSLWRSVIDPSDPYTFLFLKRGILRMAVTPFLASFVFTSVSNRVRASQASPCACEFDHESYRHLQRRRLSRSQRILVRVHCVQHFHMSRTLVSCHILDVCSR